MSDYLVIFVTTPDVGAAEMIARSIVEEKFAACVNIVPGVKSFYHWEGKIEHSEEALLVIKTTKMLFPKVESCVRAMHSYDTPEIIACPVIRGSQPYLSWIDKSVLKG